MFTPDKTSRIDWVRHGCQLLRAIEVEFHESKPFRGLTIGTGIHLEPKTVALLLTLQSGGARVVAAGNLNSTQLASLTYLRAHGVDVFAEPTTDTGRHAESLKKVLNEKPDLLLDNGADLFARFLDAPYSNLIGGTEETTSGRMRLHPLRGRLNMPILVINDSPIKQFAENKHAVGQSIFESYLRLTNRSTNGKRVTVFGYGACGQGVAACFRNAFSIVSVVDLNPVATLSAHFDGFVTPDRRDAIQSADVIVTVTAATDVLVAADIADLKDDVVLMNGGHFPREIAVQDIVSSEFVRDHISYENAGIESVTLDDGRVIHILCAGHMANLAGPRALGNSIEAMDIGFALQARCLEHVAKGLAVNTDCVVPVPTKIDEKIAQDYLAFHC